MTTMRLRGREAIISKRDPMVSSREQMPGPSSQTEQKQINSFYEFTQEVYTKNDEHQYAIDALA